jgi:two-component system nitrogen regulation sensor histidine kinase NtrY
VSPGCAARAWRSIGTFGLVTLGPVLALATFLVLGPLAESVVTPALRLVLLADLIYILVVAALVLQGGRARHRLAPGALGRVALHLRLTGVFTIVALVPTILVAVFATITVNMGLEGWFSDRVSTALGNSVDAAVAYQHRTPRRPVAGCPRAGGVSQRQPPRRALPHRRGLRQLLSQGQGGIQRGLREAFVIDGGGEIRARGRAQLPVRFRTSRRRGAGAGRATGSVS